MQNIAPFLVKIKLRKICIKKFITFLNQPNGIVQSKTGEKYSNNSFCVLSSLIHLNKNKKCHKY